MMNTVFLNSGEEVDKMNEKVFISTRKSTKENWDDNEIFNQIIINVDRRNFSKSHYINLENKMTSEFKGYMKLIFDVKNSQELIKKTKGDWTLTIEDGIGDPIINNELRKVTLYNEDFELYYSNAKKIKGSSKTIKDLFNENKKPSTANITRIVEKIADRSEQLTFIEKEKQSLKSNIPVILMNNNIRLDKEDVFEINKIEVEEIINIGRMILNNDRKIKKILGVNDVLKESTWQKYFEKYGTYLLFGSVKLDPQVCLDKEKTKEFNNKYPDILTRNRYGFIDIIELKRSDVELFKFDNSHKKFVPTSYLSAAISQLNGYLQTIPYAFNVDDAKKQSLECASGMLIVGSEDRLLKNSNELKKWCQENRISDDDLKFQIRQELRKLNYSYSHIQVVLYDEVINTLELFINNIK